MQVLVVDDEPAIVSLIADVLVDEGYEVTQAHDGRTALAFLRDGLQPNIVITDVMMPGLDGTGLYHALRSEFEHLHIGVLIVSAGKKVSLNDPHALFLAKPFSVMALLDAIERLA